MIQVQTCILALFLCFVKTVLEFCWRCRVLTLAWVKGHVLPVPTQAAHGHASVLLSCPLEMYASAAFFTCHWSPLDQTEKLSSQTYKHYLCSDVRILDIAKLSNVACAVSVMGIISQMVHWPAITNLTSTIMESH